MEETKLFAKGLHKDFDAQNQPEHSYVDAVNWIRNLDGSLTSEKGSTVLCDNTPNKDIVGSYVIDNTLVLYFNDSTSSSLDEIGYIDLNTNVYTSKIISSHLDFDREHVVRSRGRVDYRGHRIIYFVDGKNANRVIDLDRDYTGLSIENELKLQLDSKLPEVKYKSTTYDGELPTGIYQLQARLVTSSGNKGMVSIPTNPIPVIDETGATADGAIPQSKSGSSINIDINSIDNKFKFVEIIAITYEGTSNILKAYIVGRRQITGNSMSFTLSSMNQVIEEITVDEVTIEPVVYNSGKLVEYKDGRLLIAGMTSRTEGSSFQQVANNIRVEYTIKNIPHRENLNWIPPTVGNDTQPTTDVIVPASAIGKEGYAIEANTVNSKGFMREEVYSLSITPVYKDGTTGFAYHIPGQYSEYDIHEINPADPKTKRCGVFRSTEEYPEGFGYPRGTTVGDPKNRIRHHVMPTSLQEPIYDNGNIRVLGLKLVNIDLSVLPTSERDKIDSYIIGYQRRTSSNKRILCQGIAQPLVRRRHTNMLYVTRFEGKTKQGIKDDEKTRWVLSNTVIDDHVDDNSFFVYEDAIAFYSPETIFGETPNADWIDRIGSVRGIATTVLLDIAANKERDEFKHHMIHDFGRLRPVTKSTRGVYKDTIQQIPAEISGYHYYPTDFKVEGKSIFTAQSNGYLFFHTNGALPLYEDSSSRDANAPFNRSIYNLRANRPRQYGQVTNAEYVYLAHANVNTTSLNIFNGDTFINKTAIMSNSAEATHKDNVTDLKHHTLNYVFLESSINTNYRHTVQPSLDSLGTIPYFPKTRVLWSALGQNGLFQIEPRLGHSTAYNRQYSFDGGIKKFFPKPLMLEEEVSRFDNRVIYSEVSLEGEQFDANRLFLPNNYHDVAKHKGSITDMFVHNNQLYFHTPRTLWRAFFNENTTQLSSSGEIVLGNGGLFPRPSMEVFTLSGGYAGTSSTAGLNTPFGRIFIDESQGKVFMLGESVEEISMNGMSKWFIDNLTKAGDTSYTGYTAGYDYDNRRYLLTKKNVAGWTISYMPELKSWSCFHTYQPNFYITLSNKLVSIKEKKVYEMNSGEHGKFFTATKPSPSTLEVIFNQNPLITKIADNLFIQGTCPNKIEVNNSYQGSGELDVNLVNTWDYDNAPVIAKYKNSNIQMNIPRTNEETRFRDKYNKIKLIYDNVANTISKLNYVTLLFRQNHR